MKHTLLLLASIFLFTVGSFAQGRFVTLADDNGRTIQARVIGKSENGEGWTVERKDGRVVVIPFLMLNSESVAIVQAELARVEVGAPADHETVWVTCEAVKSVAGKHRYFFTFRNLGPKPFAGQIKVTLQNAMPGITNGNETFQGDPPLETGLARVGFKDVNTGPRSVHGDASVTSFSFEVIEDGKVIFTGQGSVPAELTQ